jgi:hypothetical protein
MAVVSDTYWTKITLGAVTYVVSFIPSTQTVIYTALGSSNDGGEFKIAFGWICSKSPSDFLLESELRHHLEYNKCLLT